MDLKRIWQFLMDPYQVWRIQAFFGVRKVKEVRGSGRTTWVALDSKLMPSPLPENLKISTPPELTAASFEEEHRYNLRIRAVKKEQLGQEDSASVCSSGYSSEAETEEASIIYYEIGNYLWNLVFHLGSQMGDETFYCLFFAFWFWNIDGAVGRRVMLTWTFIMYFGQGLKDIIRWPRPSMPPVVQLERRWALEYGMPSTHAMVGVAVPASSILFTMHRYIYPFYLWVAIACTWCSLVCCSRLYLGMHSLADIVVGLFLSCCLMPIFSLLADSVDNFLLSSQSAPFFSISITLLAVWMYPGSNRWTPAWGDTVLVLGGWLGQQLGNWTNYQLGLLAAASIPPPYPILWPTWHQYGLTLLRVVIGGVIAVATRAIFKPLSYLTACYLLNANAAQLKEEANDINNKKKLIAELSYKYLTYTAIGFNITFLAPAVFRVLGCERPSFYTEI